MRKGKYSHNIIFELGYTNGRPDECWKLCELLWILGVDIASGLDRVGEEVEGNLLEYGIVGEAGGVRVWVTPCDIARWCVSRR